MPDDSTTDLSGSANEDAPPTESAKQAGAKEAAASSLQESTKFQSSEASLQSVEEAKPQPKAKVVARNNSKNKLLKRGTSLDQKDLALQSLGGAAGRVASKDKIAKTSHRAAILIATNFFADSDSDSDSSDEEGFGGKKPKKTRLGRLRAGRDYIIGILQKYSIPLCFGVFLALVWSNVDEKSYMELVHWTPIKDFKMDGKAVDFHFVINDFFMCFFFGLAIKEVTEALLPGGSLSPLSRAANPLLATFGGVVGPAATYVLVTLIFYSTGALDQPMCLPADFVKNATDSHGDDHRRLAGGAGGSEYSPSDYNAKCSLEAVLKGWGVPTATDISLAWMFAILIFGPGHAAINFLLLLAILDDALGMIIIAAFYPDPQNPVEPIWLLLVLAGMVVAFGLRKLKVTLWQAYIVFAAPLSWAGLFKAHVHPALSLVFIVPFMPATHAIAPQGPRDLGRVDTISETSSRELVSTQSRRSSASRRTSVSSALGEVAIMASKSMKNLFYNEENAPLHVFEHTLKVLVDFGMFFFGLLNAGVKLDSIGGVTACVGIALVVGKIVGIAGMSLLGHCIGAPLPKGLSIPDLVATSALGGIGLTVALFVANEAFVQPEMRGQAKMGAVLSIACGGIAFLINRIFAKGKDAEETKTPIIGITVRHVDTLDTDDSQAFGRLFDVSASDEVQKIDKNGASEDSRKTREDSPTVAEKTPPGMVALEAAGLPNTVEDSETASHDPGQVLA